MGFPALKTEETYTYADYLTWSDDERWELIGGAAYNMSAAPSTRHQEAVGELFFQIRSFLKDKGKCKAFFAPFDVRLPKAVKKHDHDITDTVQPDIAVICDPEKIDDKGCLGAPDFIIEVLSPFTASKDYIKKRALYETHGVKEYWLVHPYDNLVTVFVMGNDGRYETPVFHEGKGLIEVKALPGLSIDMDAVFGE